MLFSHSAHAGQVELKWEEPKEAVLPVMHYDAVQLANRTQGCLQYCLPLNSPLRWNVFVQDDRFTFALSRRFRVRMAASLAYAYGLILDSEGWVTSPDLQAVGGAHQKSILVAPQPHRLSTAMCDLEPRSRPLLYRLALPRGVDCNLRVRARNGAAREEGRADGSLGAAVDWISHRLPPPPPPPPPDLRADGVLSSAIVVSWGAPVAHAGDQVLHVELRYRLPNGCEETRLLAPLKQGHEITTLRPGQTVRDIRARCVGRAGPGPFSAAAAATTQCVVPDPPRLLRCVSSTSTAVSFEWDPPLSDGGSEVVEWELGAFLPDGAPLRRAVASPHCTGLTLDGCPEGAVGRWVLNATVRCRNRVGWSRRSAAAHGRCDDCPWLFTDRRQERVDAAAARHRAAVDGLLLAIEQGHGAVGLAEAAACQPAVLKKALMEEAENGVVVAEDGLAQAIRAAEEAGLKELGIVQPPEDIQARLLLHVVQNKRGRRWGASTRGPQI